MWRQRPYLNMIRVARARCSGHRPRYAVPGRSPLASGHEKGMNLTSPVGHQPAAFFLKESHITSNRCRSSAPTPAVWKQVPSAFYPGHAALCPLQQVTQLARAGVFIKSNVLGRCARASQTFPARVRGGNKTRARSHSGNRSRQRRSLRYQPASAIARPYRRTMMTQFGPPECLVELRTWGRRFAIRSPNLLFGLVSTQRRPMRRRPRRQCR